MGIYLCSVLQIMASVHRNTIRIIFVSIPLQLKELISMVPETSSFTKKYGRLLNLVTSSFDVKMMRGTLSVLWPQTPLLHISRLLVGTHHGRVLSNIGCTHSGSDAFHRFRCKAVAMNSGFGDSSKPMKGIWSRICIPNIWENSSMVGTGW